jgi:ABC-type uncharacterized transport system substrate-binding protein
VTVRAVMAGLALAAAGLARAAEVAVVTQPGVAQYAEVLAGLREGRATEPVDVGDAAAVAAALARRPAAVIAIGSKALEALRGKAGAPVVAAGVLGLEPGPSLTGVPMDVRPAAALELLAALAPRARRVLALHPPGASAVVAAARGAAKALGLEVEFATVEDLADFQGAFRRLLEGRDAVWLLADPRLARPELVKFMAGACLERRVPLVGFLDGMTRAGALASVSADFRAIGREAGKLADDVAARGPGAAPPLRWVDGKITINARVLDALQPGGHPPPGAEIVR